MNSGDTGGMDKMPESLFEQLRLQMQHDEETRLEFEETKKRPPDDVDMMDDITRKTYTNNFNTAPVQESTGAREKIKPIIKQREVNNVDMVGDISDSIVQEEIASRESNIRNIDFHTDVRQVRQQTVDFLENSNDENIEYYDESGNIEEEQFASQEISDLVLLGKITQTVDFNGNKIVMRTLNGLDNINIMDEISHFKDETKKVAGVISALARSIVSLNGEKLYASNKAEVSYSKFKTLYDAKKWLMSLQQPTINYLYSEYQKLLKQQSDAYGEIKNL